MPRKTAEPVADPVATFEAKIAPELKQFIRPIGDASRHPDNIRKHRLDKIAQSLRSHGQRAAIVVQASSGLIVKGNGTHEAAEMLGWTELAQIWQEMSDDEAIAFLYADNKASDFSTYDRDKTIAGLQKLVAGPGLFDTLWEIEELADLVEEAEGVATLAPQATDAALAIATETVGGEPITASKAPPERMKEVPLVMTLAEHAAFVDQVKTLSKRYGTSGTIATITEAVKREHARGETAPDADAIYAAKRSVVVELRDYVASLGDRSFSGTWLMAQLERLVPYREVAPATPEVAGQQTLDEQLAIDLEGEPEVPAETPAGVPFVSPIRDLGVDEDEDDIAQLEALARYRAGSR